MVNAAFIILSQLTRVSGTDLIPALLSRPPTVKGQRIAGTGQGTSNETIQ